MIQLKNIEEYQGFSLSRGKDFLYIPPHKLLQPYISCYTITFPVAMPNEYTILPTASSTIVVSVSDSLISSGLRGVNTKASKVGAKANKMKLLLLIEFRPGGLEPFLNIDQTVLLDQYFSLHEFDSKLTHMIEEELIKASDIVSLIDGLNELFLTRFVNFYMDKRTLGIANKIMIHNGNISPKELSVDFHYSERHIRRLFLQKIGITPKMFSRIVRVNYALQLIQSSTPTLLDITTLAGFFDQSHFIHDFKEICGMSPTDYIKNMSVFYNDKFKM